MKTYLSHRVRWISSQQRVVREGDLKGTIDLEKLSELPHLYGIGPLEELKGEVTIINGTAFIARVEDKDITVDRSFHHKAGVFFGVYSWSVVRNIHSGIREDCDGP